MEQDGGRISFIVGQLLELPKCGSGFCIYILKYVKGRAPGTAYLVPFIKEANSSWEIPYMLLR